ncbi:MAG: DUF523 and DUF1722 domain-containing protein [Nitrospirota bacterium]
MHFLKRPPVRVSPVFDDRKIKIGISSCLLGEKVRYDGGHKQDRYLTDTLGRYVEWVPVCPEVEYGLPVPRDPMRLVDSPGGPRLVTIKTGVDHTDGMKAWSGKKLDTLEREGLSGFIFKSRSPSSGHSGVKVYSPSGVQIGKGRGIFAGAYTERFPLVPVEDEGRLNDPELRENFIERVFVFKRWRDFIRTDGTTGGLVTFHTSIKLLLMSHSQKHYSLLGRMVAGENKGKPRAVYDRYISLLMEGLKLIATKKKNTNVLMHIAGYFKKMLSPDAKAELLESIENYHKGLIPLIAPLTLINHYVRLYDVQYLKRQHYLNPHPLELMLRNHV